MDTLKISICIFLVLSAASISKSTFLKYKPLANRACNNGIDNYCFCFKSHGGYKKVPEIINQGKGNLERIVVYYYKNKNTGEIKMHFPNSEKQALIPDLAFEVGDKLNTIDINSEVYRLFDSYNNGGIIPFHPNELPIFDYFKKKIIYGSSENDNDIDFDNPLSTEEPSQNTSENAESDSVEASTIRFIINQTDSNENWDTNKNQSTEVIDSFQDLLDNEYGWDVPFENEVTESNNQTPDTTSNTIDYITPLPINVTDESFGEITEPDSTESSQTPISNEQYVEQYEFDKWNAPNDNTPINILPSFDDLLHENITQPDSSSVESSREDEHEIDYTAPDGDNRYETFDIWFAKQMDRFRTYTHHDKTFNLPIIEKHIHKILRDNGMNVTPEGVLEDSSGMALNVQKLNLRPILIGNTITKLFNKKTSGLIMPQNVEYLQAILVSSLDPALMLGIIPIGKTVIPSSKKEAYGEGLKPHIPYLGQKQTLKPYFRYQGQTQTHTLPQTFDWNLIKKVITIPDKKIVQNFSTKKNLPKFIKNKIRVIYRPKKLINTNLYDKQMAPSDSVDGMSKLITLIHPYQNQHITYTKPTPGLFASLIDKVAPLLKSHTNMSPDPKINESSDENDTEDDLAPRIIGGNAATSSGLPISVKGRMKEEEK